MGNLQHRRAAGENRPSEEKGRHLLILRLNLAVLTSLGVLSLVLPLSGDERWTLLLAIAVLAGFNWAAMDLLGRR